MYLISALVRFGEDQRKKNSINDLFDSRVSNGSLRHDRLMKNKASRHSHQPRSEARL